MITTVTLNASIDKAYHMKTKIESGSVMRVSSVKNSAGGKGLNVARVIRLCDSEVIATGLVGGYNGAYLEDLLSKNNIRHKFGHVSGETRSCINILDPCFGSTEYLEPGCTVSEEEINQYLNHEFLESIKDSEIVTISGSAPKGAQTDIYYKMTEMIKKYGKQVILDTSGELLEEGMKAKPTLVKPNKDEMQLLFGIKIDSEEQVIRYAKKIYEMGIPYVVVSLGKNGAIMVCKDGIFHAVSPELKVVNTVGCGDSMVGAFAVALEHKLEPESALKYAVSVASANAMSPDTGHFEPDMSRKILKQVKVKRL